MNTDSILMSMDFSHLELRIAAHMQNYQQLALRTCPDSYHPGLVPAAVMSDACEQFIAAAERLNLLKRAFAYGKEMPEHTPLPSQEYVGSVNPHIIHAILGIGSEAGELVEAMTASLFGGKTFDVVNFQEECGDVAWYRAIGLHAADQSIEDNDRQNIDKLVERFPLKFEIEAALNRDLAAERAVLEGTPTATLKDVIFFNRADGTRTAYGAIYGDALARFPDGHVVMTTAILRMEGDLAWTQSGNLYRIETRLSEDVDVQDVFDAELFAYGPDHNRIRGVNGEGETVVSGRVVLEPFVAADEYGGAYRGMNLATDETTVYRFPAGIIDIRDAPVPAANTSDSNGISRV